MRAQPKLMLQAVQNGTMGARSGVVSILIARRIFRRNISYSVWQPTMEVNVPSRMLPARTDFLTIGNQSEGLERTKATQLSKASRLDELRPLCFEFQRAPLASLPPARTLFRQTEVAPAWERV